MWQLIDSRTLFVASALVSGAIAVLMLATMRSFRTYPGYACWTASMAMLSLSLSLLALRGRVSDFACVVVGNLLSMVALLLAAQGIRIFCEERRHLRWMYLYCILMWALHTYFYYVQNDFGIRVLITSVLLVSLGIYSALPLVKEAPEGRKFGYRFAAGVFLFSIPQALLRLVVQLRSPHVTELFHNSAPNILYFSSVLIFVVGLGFSFALLNHERLVAELRVANTSLMAETEERLHIQERLKKAERLEAIGRLAGGISHIFNNQMCVVQLYCEQLLESPEVPGKLRPVVKKIATAGERTAAITQQLMQFARSKALKNSAFDMREWLHTISGDLQRTLGNGTELVIESGPGEMTVFADADQLSGVLLCLAENARQAMPAGGSWTLRTERVRLLLREDRASLGLPDGNYICLSATDTGCGMSEETVNRLFEPFYSTKGLAEAEGLGLASAFGLLQQSGGTITASSTVGKGSSFCIYLPEVSFTRT